MEKLRQISVSLEETRRLDALKREMGKINDELNVERDHNAMRKAVVDLFNSRLVVLESQSVTLLGMQTATLEMIREMNTRSPAPAALTDRERRALEFARSLE